MSLNNQEKMWLRLALKAIILTLILTLMIGHVFIPYASQYSNLGHGFFLALAIVTGITVDKILDMAL